MTTEEKAKAYDMALEAARKELGVDRKEWELVERVLRNIFPELRESEDEEIRKGIVATIEQCSDILDPKNQRQMLAWLEKQKDDRMKPIYDARESFESALEKAWNDYHNGYENVDKLEDDYVECAHAKGFREGYLFGIEKQKESLHIPETCKENIEPFTDDEMIRRTLVEYFGPEVQLDFVRGVPIQKIRDWLERQKEQKPALSEDDERIRKKLLNLIEWSLIYASSGVTVEDANEMTAYLNKQKEQKHDGKKWIYEDEYQKDLDRLYNEGKDEVLNNPTKYGLQKEQKPVEWNEEKERVIKDAIYALEEVGGYPCIVKELKKL